MNRVFNMKHVFFLNMCLQIADLCVCEGKNPQYREIAAHL